MGVGWTLCSPAQPAERLPCSIRRAGQREKDPDDSAGWGAGAVTPCCRAGLCSEGSPHSQDAVSLAPLKLLSPLVIDADELGAGRKTNFLKRNLVCQSH